MTSCWKLLVPSILLLYAEMSLSIEWSECSRSCGSGISYRAISCHGHTKNCTGTQREYKVCNTEECPVNSTDFRTKQCQKIREHSISFSNVSDSCKLMCGLPGELPMEKGTVVDGTPCGVSGVCVAGTCIPVGCDGVLGSDKRIDNCGQCGATKGVCLHVPCNIEKADKWENESHVKLPAGSSYVKLQLKSSACSLLAIQNKTFYLDYTTTITISRNQFELCGNKLTAYGPLDEEILIQIYHCQPNEIQCKYYIPVHEAIISFFASKRSQSIDISEYYKWVVGGNYTECSRTCGTGIQKSEIYCVKVENNERVKSDCCKYLPKDKLQPLVRSCSNSECPYEWKVSNWTPCSKSCDGGIKRRDVACIQAVSFESVSVNSTACLGEKPDSRKACNNHPCHNHWYIGLYSECSKSCGEGERRRDVTCLNACRNKIDDSNCNMLAKPREVDKCIGDMCAYKWTHSNWSNCSVACGEGIQTRAVECYHVADNVPVNESFCACNISIHKPKAQRSCNDTRCVGKWFTDEWGKCTALECCTEGKQYRNIYCYYKNIHLLDIKCPPYCKPTSEKLCVKTKGCSPTWAIMFGPCNRNCVKVGTLKCMLCHEVVHDSLCPSDKPSVIAKCDECGCDDKGICKRIPTDTDHPAVQKLLCILNCCGCRSLK